MRTDTSSKGLKSAREVALKVLYKIEQEEIFAEEGVEKYCAGLRFSREDRRLVGELVFGTTKLRKRIDYLISQVLDEKLERLTPWMRNILRMGIYQLEFTDKIPAYAAINESVNLAKKYGHTGVASLVNGVLRNYERKKEQIKFPPEELEYISTFFSFPEWLIEKWLSSFGRENVIGLCEYFNRKPNLGVRVNQLKSSTTQVEDYFQKNSLSFRKGSFLEGFYYLESPLELDELELLPEGKIYIQDEASLLAVELLDPKPGEKVLDLCAGPGGKSGYISQRMQNQGKVIAVDTSETKLQLVRENCQRLGATIVETVLGDAVDFATTPVDKILVDAPCSGTGVLNRNADARWQKKPEDLERLTKLQLSILENAVSLLKSGGVIVYSTCSIMPEENQIVIGTLLEKHSELKVADAGQLFSAELATQEGYLRTLPFMHKIDGAFAVKLIKE